MGRDRGRGVRLGAVADVEDLHAAVEVSTATPTPADLELADSFQRVVDDGLVPVDEVRRWYWHTIEIALRNAHPDYSARDVTRVARIMAPFPLRDRYADH